MHTPLKIILFISKEKVEIFWIRRGLAHIIREGAPGLFIRVLGSLTSRIALILFYSYSYSRIALSTFYSYSSRNPVLVRLELG